MPAFNAGVEGCQQENACCAKRLQRRRRRSKRRRHGNLQCGGEGRKQAGVENFSRRARKNQTIQSLRLRKAHGALDNKIQLASHIVKHTLMKNQSLVNDLNGRWSEFVKLLNMRAGRQARSQPTNSYGRLFCHVKFELLNFAPPLSFERLECSCLAVACWLPPHAFSIAYHLCGNGSGPVSFLNRSTASRSRGMSLIVCSSSSGICGSASRPLSFLYSLKNSGSL